jgi:phosphoglycerate kinase
MNKQTIQDVNVQGKKVFVRVDFNVPMKDGVITNDTRVRATLPTLNYLLEQGAAVILGSHLGRPKGQRVPEFTLAPVAVRLGELLGREVKLAPDCVGEEVSKMAAELKSGEVLLLKNLRYHKEEEKNGPEFAKALA